MLDSLDRIPDSTLKDFLLDGPEDFKTEKDAQDFAVAYRDALFDLYNYLKTNASLELVVNLNPLFFGSAIQNYYNDSCVVQQNDDQAVRVVCDRKGSARRKINSADMLAMRQSVAGAYVYSFIYTNYTADGAADIVKRWKDQKPDSQTLVNWVRAVPSVGLLRGDHKWANLKALGADFSSAWSYALQNQGTLCPGTPWDGQKKRPGMLFDDGLCSSKVPTRTQQALGLIDQALTGPVTGTFWNQGVERQIKVDPFLMATKPIADAKSLLPSKFDACNHGIALFDPTVGGVIPNGESDWLLQQKCNPPASEYYVTSGDGQ